ncbi:hypothetical protein Glove_283g146 [Diversispora epigaea]|uniref:Cytochrome c oxidase assembly protein COX16, mitochondrial n=1 Tax=Diversispora epigaea TaxID=1348612 RepID=A0A397I8U9_9GLOM|nr:hypothetical protein Glove_283g146 [Diversispora epigaea]
MNPFPRKFYRKLKYEIIRQHPFTLFGLPMVLSLVVGSFALSRLTQTRYDVHSNKAKKVEKEQILKIDKDKRKFNAQEEYWRLQANDDWEIKRVERPKDE